MSDKNLFEPTPLPMPIASEGNYVVIPDDQAVTGDGKASIARGFAPETAKQLDDGGKAVRRQDLNGLFNRLSQILYWVQSGGHFTYKQTVNYAPNCMVIYNNQFYICTAANGPDEASGVKDPSTATTYWVSLSKFGDFITDGSSISNLTFTQDGLKASFSFSGSTQSSISPSGGSGVFNISTFRVNSGIGGGVYDIKDILQRLIKMSHTHTSVSISGDGKVSYCTYCSYCSYCCHDCCQDCGDDSPY